MTNDQQPHKVHAQAKKPVGRTCLPCGGKGWMAPQWIKGPRPVRSECQTCHGKGRVTV